MKNFQKFFMNSIESKRFLRCQPIFWQFDRNSLNFRWFDRFQRFRLEFRLLIVHFAASRWFFCSNEIMNCSVNTPTPGWNSWNERVTATIWGFNPRTKMRPDSFTDNCNDNGHSRSSSFSVIIFLSAPVIDNSRFPSRNRETLSAGTIRRNTIRFGPRTRFDALPVTEFFVKRSDPIQIPLFFVHIRGLSTAECLSDETGSFIDCFKFYFQSGGKNTSRGFRLVILQLG